MMKRLLCVWGNAEHGRLGLGKVTGGEVWPQICQAIENVKTVCCGGAHTVAVTGIQPSIPLSLSLGSAIETGEVWSFGLNSEGQLGHSSDEDSVSVMENMFVPLVQ